MNALDEISELLKSCGLSEFEIDDLIARLLDEELPRLAQFNKVIDNLVILDEEYPQDLDRNYYLELIDLLESFGLEREVASNLFFKAHNELKLSECLFSDLGKVLGEDDINNLS